MPGRGRPRSTRVLGVTRSASDEEVRRALQAAARDLRDGGLATSSLLDEARARAPSRRSLDEAYDTLLDPVRRRAYDLSTFPETEPLALSARADPPRARRRAAHAPAGAAREIGPDTEFSGALLRKVRESQGVELRRHRARTKIARAHLQAIEDEEFEDLPALVYMRGFLGELAK